jgi:tetratricopeptide (TPR) repeat protein
MRFATATLMILLSSLGVLAAANDVLAKAKALRSNGLLTEAKKELVEVIFAEASSDAVKAEALLILGEIAIDENKFETARENWTKLLETYPESAFAASARAKLDLLAQMSGGAAAQAAKESYPSDTVLVLPDEDYPWANVEIAAALGSSAVAVDEKLSSAVKLAIDDPNIIGIVQVDLSVDVPFESGRVVCYQPNGAKAWQKVVRMTYPGSAEAIAHRFINRLAKEVKGKRCP